MVLIGSDGLFGDRQEAEILEHVTRTATAGRSNAARLAENLARTARRYFYQPRGGRNLDRTVYRKFIGPLSELYRTFIGTLSYLYRNFIGTLSELYRTFIGTLSGLYRKPSSEVYRKGIGRVSEIIRG